MASVKSKLPKLRFKGFNGEWQSLSFARAVHEVKRPIKMQNDTDYQLITVKRRNEGIVSRGIFKGKDVLVKSQFEVKTGDYIISKRQVVHGANGILPETLDGSIVSNEYLVAKGTDKMDIQFFSILSSLPIMYKQFFLSSYGIDIEKLFFDVNDWKKRTVNVPTLKEQTQIGHFFQKLDQVIELQQNALVQSQNYKKAMLQKMFPQKGEKAPRVRFKGFSGNWVKKKLEECFDERNERAESGELISVTINSGVVLASSLERRDTSSSDKSNYKIVCIGDIAYNSMRMWQGASGLSIYSGVLSPAYTVIVPRNNISGLFFSYQFKLPFMINMFRNNSQGLTSDTWNLKFPLLKEISVKIPSLKEQTKIGNFFQQLDNQITEQKNKLTHYQTLKKAMLQRLFI